ncbi:MAG TPA: ATP-binding protein [Candidatus Avimuribaculum pullicola]|nr:ATP-binding protein [Candidatus Avimuribaculum pullicola]
MKFFDRKSELAQLERQRKIAFNDHSQMTVLTGRRRIGKTMLIRKSCEESTMVYLFVSRSNEAMLCSGFAKVINETLKSIFVPTQIDSFADLFEMLMRAGRTEKFNLVIDEFQEFFYINPTVFSKIQDIWDRYKDTTHVFFVASGSVYTLMNRIFLDAKEPLYGRCDSIIKLKPFATNVLKEVLAEYKPGYTSEDLLALYAFTGGVPKYVDLLMQNGCTDVNAMIDYIVQPYSTFVDEGNALLIQEFGRKYGNYFALLADIASGRNTLAELGQSMGDTNIAGHIKRLEEDYELIAKKRPIFAKEATQTVRFEISDLFLKFWFRYFVKYRSMVELENYGLLAELIKADYPTYSGLVLESYFKQKMAESGEYRNIGSWWQAKKGKEACEIDIVGIKADNKTAVVAEVKRLRKNFKPDEFAKKVELIRNKVLANYAIEAICLTMEDM